MNKQKMNHHTVADWDFTAGTAREIAAWWPISPPTVLRIYQPDGATDRPAILCRIAETLCIAQGEVRTWHRTNNRTRDFRLPFRNQRTLGGADYEDSYWWTITGAHATLFRTIGGADVIIGDFAVSFASNEWNHWRTIYWNGLNAVGEPALCVELYKEVAGEWIQQGETLYDTENQWADSEINRSGIGCWVDGVNYHLFDDTEIWGAV